MFTGCQAMENFTNAGTITLKRDRSKSCDNTTFGSEFGASADGRAASPFLPPFDGNDEEDAEPPASTTHATAGIKLNRKERSQLKAEKQIAWLESELAARPGYQEFKDSRNRAKNYVAVVQSWEFASAFDKEYSDTMRGVSACDSLQYVHSLCFLQGFQMGKITNAAVQGALGVRSIWTGGKV
jgi:hypothetical protein